METVQCPHCGVANDTGQALCENCQSPLTAYAGQLSDQSYKGKLAEQAALADVRPPTVIAMVVFLSLTTVAGPLRSIVNAFARHETLNAENTNYVASAFGALGPILTTIVAGPVALALLWLGWATFTQNVRSWQLCQIVVIVVGLLIAVRHSDFGAWTWLWLAMLACLEFAWFRPTTRAWYGMN